MTHEVSTNWVEELAFEVALEYFAPEDLQLKFELSPQRYQRITSVPEFKRAVADYRREIDDEGIAFKLRARKCAELMLEEIHEMAFDQRVDAKTRLEAMKTMCHYAGYDMKTAEDGGGIKVQIISNLSLNDQNPQGVYTIEMPQEALPHE